MDGNFVIHVAHSTQIQKNSGLCCCFQMQESYQLINIYIYTLKDSCHVRLLKELTIVRDCDLHKQNNWKVMEAISLINIDLYLIKITELRISGVRFYIRLYVPTYGCKTKCKQSLYFR